MLLSFPEKSKGDVVDLPLPRVTLLEYNASPDFHQSGNRLRKALGEMFRGVVELSVKPFFGLGGVDASDEEAEVDAAERKEACGWRLVGQGEVRGPTKS